MPSSLLAMGNSYSCSDDRCQTNSVVSSLLSRITSKSHRSLSPLIRASSSYEKDPRSHVSQPPLSRAVISTPSPLSPFHPSLSTYVSLTQLRSLGEQAVPAYAAFLRRYPEYHNTWIIDTLRQTEFARMDQVEETYVDYMAGAQYPDCLVRLNGDFLLQHIMGNSHSINNSSRVSSECADEARNVVLSFFQAPRGYTVIFTPNATGALKLVGEAFPFRKDGTFVLGADSHNSVHGIREFAARRGAQVNYIPSLPTGGFDPSVAKDILRRNRPDSRTTPSLFALTGQSNISNTKNPLSILHYASSLGYSTLMDAAALAPTSMISLTETPVDAMAVSFYKMFGYPTGVGALIIKESFLGTLKRPWFSGGTVDVVQVPGMLVTRAAKLHEQFEDGTTNYLALSAVTDGLRFLSAYLPFLPLRLSCLMHFITSSLAEIRHDTNGMPVIKILSRLPSRHLRLIGEQSDTGSTVSFIVLSPTGEMLPNSFVDHVAMTHSISLRTGCMCNPGGASAMLGIQHVMESLGAGETLNGVEERLGRELGVVRVSLGLASDWGDVWRVIQVFQGFGVEQQRVAWWDAWKLSADDRRQAA